MDDVDDGPLLTKVRTILTEGNQYKKNVNKRARFQLSIAAQYVALFRNGLENAQQIRLLCTFFFNKWQSVNQTTYIHHDQSRMVRPFQKVPVLPTIHIYLTHSWQHCQVNTTPYAYAVSSLLLNLLSKTLAGAFTIF